jgi:uncharacterized protein
MVIRHFLTVLAVILFIPSQVFWVWQLRRLGAKFIRSRAVRRRMEWVCLGVYLALMAYNLWPSSAPESAHMTLQAALLVGPFRWWMLASLAGFVLIAAFYLFDHLGRGLYRKFRELRPPAPGEVVPLPSPARRRFLTRTAVAVSATPFAACAYGMFYERTELEVTHHKVPFRRLPKAFDGFRIAQISDIHIGSFMPVEDIRRYVAIANRLRPDLVVLTGDFVTWKGSPAATVVEALSALRAPFGIWGCLGNHERWAGVDDSITAMFAQHNIKILRQDNAAVALAADFINLIGVDYQTRAPFGPPRDGVVKQYLEGVDRLMLPDTVNILLSHNPNTFDRAAELGVDLSLAGHTHGGQVTLEYISPDLSPARLITQYVRGWFTKGASRLYVNRGIGTIFSPVRVGSPPEITEFELKRA